MLSAKSIFQRACSEPQMRLFFYLRESVAESAQLFVRNGDSSCMGLSYSRSGGAIRVYRCTSKRMPGRESPVSSKEYVGTFDEDSGLICPKKATPEEAEGTVRDCNFRALDRGSVTLALWAAEQLNLPRRLESLFGECGRTILAMAVCYSVNPFLGSDVVGMSRLMDLESIIGQERLTARMISEASSSVNLDSVRSFSLAGIDEISGRIRLFGLRGSMNEIAMASPGIPPSARKWNFRDAAVAFIAGEDGVPRSFIILAGHRHDTKLLTRFIRTCGCGRPPLIILKRQTDDPCAVAHALMAGLDVIVDCIPSSEPVKNAMRGFVEGDEDGRVEYEGSEYSYVRRTLGLDNGGRCWEYGQAGRYRINLFVCRRVGAVSMKGAEVEEYIARQIVANTDAGIIEEGPSMRGSDIPESSDIGDVMSYMRKRRDVKVFLTSLEDLSEVLDAVDGRENTVANANHIDKALFQGEFWNDADPCRLFAMTLSISIRSMIGFRLKQGRLRGTNVDQAFVLASGDRVVVCGNRRYEARSDKRTAELLDAVINGP